MIAWQRVSMARSKNYTQHRWEVMQQYPRYDLENWLDYNNRIEPFIKLAMEGGEEEKHTDVRFSNAQDIYRQSNNPRNKRLQKVKDRYKRD
jgi:hypothetical protein